MGGGCGGIIRHAVQGAGVRLLRLLPARPTATSDTAAAVPAAVAAAAAFRVPACAPLAASLGAHAAQVAAQLH